MYRTASDRWPQVGAKKMELETPVLLFDLEVMKENMERYLSIANEHGVALRPHIKVHKIPEIAQMQIEMADAGVMCQKLGEAEVMARHGIKDIILVCPVVTRSKLENVIWLNDRVDSFAMVADSESNIEPIETVARENGARVTTVLEIDVGGERMGSEPGAESAAVAARIASSDHLRFGGLLAYDNHVLYESDSPQHFRNLRDSVFEDIERTIMSIEDRGVDISDVRVGTTGTAHHTAEHPLVTEINPGRYLLNDTSMVKFVDWVSKEDCAATFLTTVLSKPTDDRVVVDTGAKSMSWTRGHKPICVTCPDIEYVHSSSEHGIVDTSESPRDIQVGDKLEFITRNIYGAINLQEYVIGVVGDSVETVWNVAARGKSR